VGGDVERERPDEAEAARDSLILAASSYGHARGSDVGAVMSISVSDWTELESIHLSLGSGRMPLHDDRYSHRAGVR
jgi:hypothetical protein